MPMYVWDEICQEAKLVTDANPGIESWEPGAADAELMPWYWRTDHVIDLPDGTRIVIESDNRAHTAVWVTTKED
jgi:hypothetical protein